jgi:hypothetical protein
MEWIYGIQTKEKFHYHDPNWDYLEKLGFLERGIQTKMKFHYQNANEMNLYGAQMDKRGNNQK